MTRTRTAIVVGGGIAGPVAALALHRAGIEAAVYESHSATADGIGGALSVAPNGRAALGLVGLDRVGVPMNAIVLQNHKGRAITEIRRPMRFTWRADLYRRLYDLALHQGVPAHHGHELVDVRDSGTGIRAVFADGTVSEEADVLIGADGLRSTVRGLIDPRAPQPRYSGLLGFGARVDGAGLPPTGDRMYMAFGRRAFFGYQTFDDGSGVWFANLPHPYATWQQVRQTPNEEWLRRLGEAFAGDTVPALDLLRRTSPEALVTAGPMEDLPHVPHWHRGRMVLVGDSAHATSPSSGQGASLAAESAVELARALRDLPRSQAFAAYERARRARVERVIAEAARTNSGKAAGPVGRVFRDALLPLFARLGTPEKMEWQYDHRIHWDTAVAA
ncbi:FAD-dependent oxidoreductase [Streptomyces sp. CB01373]|uniref:FAD-dependent oxidoreductase n=1 Tax=Streptomyces sp. CB01373 TaxID=2020325 RepID=UPI000C27FAE2|nr:NAD(P)/FAD-dependent oxidoreductase [Streptomyces sp. CB01373]PJM95401.1 monooxygenase [Streptomyces sp. CB01373]